ncbi:MAG: DUF86 domain-containing protein [Chloroflexi bacterium]|nr:DUF86 domain-containing protein [Chloroflexota bacterium]
MSSRRDRDYLQDIYGAIERIQRYVGDLSREQFEQDEKTQDAVIRNLEVIGEAAKHVSALTRRDNPTIPWRDLAGVRDKLIHQYFGVNFAIVWKIVREELPPLLPQLAEILKMMM